MPSSSSPLELTLALDRYDRHFPFFDGTVSPPPGVEWTVLQVGQSATLRDGNKRHERMLHAHEFDVCEFSMSSYLMARERGMPIIGVPVFPRRLFSQSQMFVHPDSDLHHPRDLVGKKVALSSFQTTLSLLAKGDLKFEYGVPWEEIKWYVTTDEPVAFDKKPGVFIETIGKRENLGVLLEKGGIDAFFLPHPPHSVMSGKTKARRLFPDTRQEEQRYFRKYGYFPIMHLLVMHEKLAAREPWLPRALMETYAQAKAISASYYEDPNWSRLAWGRHDFESEREVLGMDPWPSGVKANRANLERFIQYSHDQHLLAQPIPVESLFPEQVLET
jgi:4,5-dihydroxyphthalate decarboxylase